MTVSFRPVVAVDVDGVLRVDAPKGDPDVGLFRRRITVRRENYPAFMHRSPEWDEHGRWITSHWISGVGAEWMRDLIARGVDVVWATTWQHGANAYFAKVLGIPPLPVAVSGDGEGFNSSPRWEAHHLGKQYPGRPLMWIDDNPLNHGAGSFEDYRRRADRPYTHFQWIRGWVGITPTDVTVMDEWIDLASSREGHEELRRRRRRHLQAVQTAKIRGRWDTRVRYRAWLRVRARLEAIGTDRRDQETLGGYLASTSTISAPEVSNILREWCSPDAPPLEELLCALRLFFWGEDTD